MSGEFVELSADECWDALRAQPVGRLAVSVGSQPDIFPVNYIVDEGELVIHTEAGTKLAAAILGGNVAFEIDGIDAETETGWSVVVHGVARESRDLGSVMRDQSLPIEPWSSTPKTRFIRIAPTRVTGRRIEANQWVISDSGE